jgi:hypothetical protein
LRLYNTSTVAKDSVAQTGEFILLDTKKLGITELIKLHNELAEKCGVSGETSFKSLGAARNAIANLEVKMNQTVNTENTSPIDGAVPVTSPTSSGDATDRSKYSSTGKRGPNQGVGAFAKDLIVAGKNNADVLAAVKARFPDARTTTGCIAFYRTALSKGSPGKTPEALRAEAAALLAKAEAAEAAKVAADAAEATPV